MTAAIPSEEQVVAWTTSLLEELAVTCQQRQRYTFMLCMEPLRWRHVPGSPVHSITIF